MGINVEWHQKDEHGVYHSTCGRFEIQKASGSLRPVEYRLDSVEKGTAFFPTIGRAKERAEYDAWMMDMLKQGESHG
jgi:hypothetical protein